MSTRRRARSTATKHRKAPRAHRHVLARLDGREIRIRQRGRRATLLTRRPDGNFGTRRPRTHEEREMVSTLGWVVATLESTDFWSAASQLPGNTSDGRGGRPTANPSWVLLLAAVIATVTGSQRSAIAFMAEPAMWDLLRLKAQQHLPAWFDPAGPTPPTRYHLRYFRERWESAEWAPHRAAAIKAFRGTALSLARERGLLNPTSPLRYDEPDAGQWVTFDATVFAPPSRHKKPGRRVDEASGWHITCGDDRKRVWGSKIVFASIRTDDHHGRVILDFEHVQGPKLTGIGDEAAATVGVARRIKQAAPGARGVIVDTVLRGKHINELSAANIHTLNHPAAKKNPNRATGGRHAKGRVEKRHKIGAWTHKRSNGTDCRHELWNIGSVFHELIPDQTGQLAFVPLQVQRVETRPNKADVRHYLIVDIPCTYGKLHARIPLHHDSRTGAKFNRGELLRFYPTDTPQFSALYGRRNDAESLHNQIKRRMRRMPAYGAVAQTLFVLAYAIGHNANTRKRHLS